jgi:hypothetical protein
MNDGTARVYMTGPAVAYHPMSRPVDNPAQNFAKIRTLAKTEDGKIISVNPHLIRSKKAVKRTVQLSDVMNLE